MASTSEKGIAQFFSRSSAKRKDLEETDRSQSNVKPKEPGPNQFRGRSLPISGPKKLKIVPSKHAASPTGAADQFRGRSLPATGPKKMMKIVLSKHAASPTGAAAFKPGQCRVRQRQKLPEVPEEHEECEAALSQPLAQARPRQKVREEREEDEIEAQERDAVSLQPKDPPTQVHQDPRVPEVPSGQAPVVTLTPPEDLFRQVLDSGLACSEERKEQYDNDIIRKYTDSENEKARKRKDSKKEKARILRNLLVGLAVRVFMVCAVVAFIVLLYYNWQFIVHIILHSDAAIWLYNQIAAAWGYVVYVVDTYTTNVVIGLGVYMVVPIRSLIAGIRGAGKWAATVRSILQVVQMH